MDTKQPEALRIADDLHHSITHYGAEDAFTFSAYEAEQCVRALHAAIGGSTVSIRALQQQLLQERVIERHGQGYRLNPNRPWVQVELI